MKYRSILISFDSLDREYVIRYTILYSTYGKTVKCVHKREKLTHCSIHNHMW